MFTPIWVGAADGVVLAGGAALERLANRSLLYSEPVALPHMTGADVGESSAGGSACPKPYRASSLAPQHATEPLSLRPHVWNPPALTEMKDALDFLGTVEADVVVLDPPYGGTQAHERAFELVDECLGVPHLPTSEFSARRPPLDELLDAAGHIPVMVLCGGNSLLDNGGWKEWVARHRRVVRVAYTVGAVTLPLPAATPSSGAINRSAPTYGSHTFPHLRSQCTMLAPCAASRHRQTSEAISRVRSSGDAPPQRGEGPRRSPPRLRRERAAQILTEPTTTMVGEEILNVASQERSA
ncbi:MAG TPA: hypothetical protein QGF35_05755 [Dehalococcoidia bacterium]|nr:hypothetical protein [Dehalococcoidia bacterium]